MSSHSATGAKWIATRDAVLARDEYTCVYCGNEATEADHVVPRSKGGSDSMDNLVACCRKCNAEKGDTLDFRNEWFNKNWLNKLS